MNDPRAFARAVAEELFSMFAQALTVRVPEKAPDNDVTPAALDPAQRRQEAKAAVRAMRQGKVK